MDQTSFALLQACYGQDVPGYIVKVDKTLITLTLAQWDDEVHPIKITMSNVIAYYRTQANNLGSGMRTIAGVTGDWRHIDRVATECLEWFKDVNVKHLRRQARQAGLEPQV